MAGGRVFRCPLGWALSTTQGVTFVPQAWFMPVTSRSVSRAPLPSPEAAPGAAPAPAGQACQSVFPSLACATWQLPLRSMRPGGRGSSLCLVTIKHLHLRGVVRDLAPENQTARAARLDDAPLSAD